jgi:hypothetical protein
METDLMLTIDMNNFGLSFVVPTDIEQVNELMEKFNNEPDHNFGDGRGKRWLVEQMDEMLSVEDDFFAEDTLRQVEQPQRWQAFLNACVAYACLSSHIADEGVPLELV